MAEALLGFVIQNLGSFVQDQLGPYWGVEQQTQKLSNNLTAIRAVLRDAEKKQTTSHAVKDWLQKLTDAAYVLDDILDECSIHSTKVHSDGHTSCLSRLHPKDILFRFNIGKRMKDITQRFDDINEEKSRFNLEHGVTQMHDLFHDLARSIMGEECVAFGEGRLTPLSSRVHYSTLLSDVSFQGFMTAFKKAESLRTFLDLRTSFAIENFGPVPSNHSLRALCTKSSLLSPLKDLTHLRYLSLSCCYKASLNNSICQMPKLQILKLQHFVFLRGLPKDLTQLQDLRHIVMDDCSSVVKTPPKISKLRHLRTLSIFVVGSKPGCGLDELHALKLGGALRIRGLKNVPSEWDAKQANLIGKKELNILHLSWDGSANSKSSNVSVERVLEALEPPSTLKSFQMNGYEGKQLSSWMRSSIVLRDLVKVKLWNCGNCEELPPFGKLPHLKRLEVSGMKNVKCIDGETYDDAEEKAFPSLEELILKNLPNLERLLRDERVEMVPHLFQLRIQRVSNLKCPRLPSVEELDAREIDEAASFMEVVGNTACLKTLSIEYIKGVVDFNEALVVADMDCMRDAMNKLGSDSKEVITSKMITLVDEVDHLYFLTESPSTQNPKF
ncbi:disease resistance protein RPM1 [Vigna unguiculata]|uniref:Disease resistance protein RPM1 n=1 Tax=Vigna unguiculata TaxID=3917 RepID=A0A4D6LPS2_VIGUN|nr:disease resistance protein RPM1 [Vigna unguiculata]